jgi:tetratricopeptide (TPR) repeat protein
VDALRRALAATDVPLAVAARGAAVLAMLGDPALARRGLPQWERGGVPAPTVAAARAYVRAAAGDVDRALEDLRASIPADPRQAASYLDVAVIQERAGRVDDAIATYRKILEASPAMGLNMAIPIARVNLGRLLQARGDTAGARAVRHPLQAVGQRAPRLRSRTGAAGAHGEVGRRGTFPRGALLLSMRAQ